MKYRPLAAVADGPIDGPSGSERQGDGDDLATLSLHDQGAVAAFETEGLDVGPGGVGDPQPV